MQRSKDCLSCSETLNNVRIHISPISSKILIKKGLWDEISMLEYATEK